MDVNSELYAEILYRSVEEVMKDLGDYIKADKDLLKSLEVANPDDAYVLNYLAYSWLEREYKIETLLFKMLEKAYAKEVTIHI